MAEDATKKIYDDMAESYDDTFSGGIWLVYDAITWKYIEDYLPESGTILDAGGGTGKWSINLAKKGYTVYLTDLSLEMLKEASQKIEEVGLSEKIHISEGDICNIDFPSDYFDFVLCEGDPVSYCTENHFQAMQELVRVAKPQSIIEIGVDSRLTFVGTYTALPIEDGLEAFSKGMAVDKWKTPTFTFTPRILQKEFEKCGADLLKVVGKPILWSFMAPFIKDLPKKIEEDAEFREKIIKFEIALNEEGFGPVGIHLQAIARKR